MHTAARPHRCAAAPFRAALGALLLLVAWTAPAGEVYEADAVKAAFLYRFTGYVSWPPEALPGPLFTIAVLGAPAVADELERLLASRSIKGLPAQVRRIGTPAAGDGAALIYVGPGYRGALQPLLERHGGRGVLLVSDRERGLDEGSAINFLLVDRRVRFEISLPAAEGAGLRIGSALLAVATHVIGGPRSDLSCPRPPTAGVPACATELASW